MNDSSLDELLDEKHSHREVETPGPRAMTTTEARVRDLVIFVRTFCDSVVEEYLSRNENERVRFTPREIGARRRRFAMQSRLCMGLLRSNVRQQTQTMLDVIACSDPPSESIRMCKLAASTVENGLEYVTSFAVSHYAEFARIETMREFERRLSAFGEALLAMHEHTDALIEATQVRLNELAAMEPPSDGDVDPWSMELSPPEGEIAEGSSDSDSTDSTDGFVVHVGVVEAVQEATPHDDHPPRAEAYEEEEGDDGRAEGAEGEPQADAEARVPPEVGSITPLPAPTRLISVEFGADSEVDPYTTDDVLVECPWVCLQVDSASVGFRWSATGYKLVRPFDVAVLLILIWSMGHLTLHTSVANIVCVRVLWVLVLIALAVHERRTLLVWTVHPCLRFAVNTLKVIGSLLALKIYMKLPGLLDATALDLASAGNHVVFMSLVLGAGFVVRIGREGVTQEGKWCARVSEIVYAYFWLFHATMYSLCTATGAATAIYILAHVMNLAFLAHGIAMHMWYLVWALFAISMTLEYFSDRRRAPFGVSDTVDAMVSGNKRTNFERIACVLIGTRVARFAIENGFHFDM